MPFIPHTEQDVSDMLAAINVDEISDLFDEIPQDLAKAELENIPTGMNEAEVTRLLIEREPKCLPGSNFIGAGAYEHHIPAAVWDIVGRGEYYTAYTPYQAEASQGTLQLIYEYQTMMASLMGLDVSNASLYDGASGLAEAVLMTLRLKRGKANRVLVPANINPRYRLVLQSVLKHHKIILEEIPYSQDTGRMDRDYLAQVNPEGLAAMIIPQPNFFGVLDEVDELTDIAHQLNAYAIGLVNPTAMALLTPPGQWGSKGVDIACGEGQPLGVPVASGGPYFGFMCCKQEYLRQLPGRLVGRTHDTKGREGFTLTLQAREQHIRRAKATSNICTNQGLLVTAATIYMSMLGAKGLRSVAAASHQNATNLRERLASTVGIEIVFDSPMFHEFVIRTRKPVDTVIKQMLDYGLQAGYNLKKFYPELGDCLLVCTTETKMPQDLERYHQLIAKCVG